MKKEITVMAAMLLSLATYEITREEIAAIQVSGEGDLNPGR